MNRRNLRVYALAILALLATACASHRLASAGSGSNADLLSDAAREGAGWLGLRPRARLANAPLRFRLDPSVRLSVHRTGPAHGTLDQRILKGFREVFPNAVAFDPGQADATDGYQVALAWEPETRATPWHWRLRREERAPEGMRVPRRLAIVVEQAGTGALVRRDHIIWRPKFLATENHAERALQEAIAAYASGLARGL